MLGREARSRGFSVQLAGGINLAPRNGRNFEYLSEDRLLSAVLAAESITGIQAEGVISTSRHYSLLPENAPPSAGSTGRLPRA